MVNSKSKGKRGELEACDVLNKSLGTNFRRSQQFKGTKDSADIIDDNNPNLYCEVKRRQSMNLHKVVEQARQEAGEKTPFVLHRKDDEKWLLTVDLRDLVDLIQSLEKARKP